MKKKQRKAMRKLFVASAIGAVIIIPAILVVNAATQKEQPKKVEEKPVAMVSKPNETIEHKPIEVLSYYEEVPLDTELQNYIIQTSYDYGIEPCIVMSMIYRESRFRVDAVGDNGQSYGLMQIQPRWHYQRMVDLGCTDLLDGYQNARVGIDILSELIEKYGDIEKALVAYNQGSYKGTITEYAKTIIEKAEGMGDVNVLYR